MDFAILGPLEVRLDGEVLAVPGGKPREVLAVLLLHANEPVNAERLAAALWGADAPATAVRTVQVHVSRLRKVLGDDAVVTTRAGYRLNVRAGELDVQRFERLLEEGRRALAETRAAQAGVLLRQALQLWRGPPLSDLSFAPFAQAEIARLEEQRIAALELRVEADLASGRHAEVVAELRRLVGEHPLRERLHGQLMRALYGSGRQADALDAYRAARELLVAQLGIEPGAELHELQRAILSHDPAIDARSPTVGSERAPTTGANAPARERLPAPPNPTIGRARELRMLAERLRVRTVRLLTLIGPGGVGKTRLALESARAVEGDFESGARFVSLAAIERADDVPPTLVAALGITMQADESPADAVERFLSDQHLLLVLDNFEHVLDAAPFVGAVLTAIPTLTVLVTSREPLDLAAEQRFRVPPLALPEAGTSEDPRTLADVASVVLFTERARTRDPDFRLAGVDAAAVAEICRRLDGLPLAIELAAARCDLFSPREIAERLHASLSALATGPRDAPIRQQSLRATLDWSYKLLSDAEKVCFARFAVFAGGATIVAAETITGATLPTLERLVAKSLLTRAPHRDAPARVAMLETVRADAGERFAVSTDHDAVCTAHYRYFLALAQRHGTDRALFGSERNEHLALLDGEIENLHAALHWAAATGNGHDALTMVATLGRYWRTRTRDAQAVTWCDRALSIAGDDSDPAIRIQVMCVKARSLRWVGRSAEAPAVMAEAEATARRLGDPTILSRTLQVAADHAAMDRRMDLCEALADEALRWAHTAGDAWEIASAAYDKAITASSVQELRERVDWAVALLEDVDNVSRLARLLTSAARAAVHQRDEHAAKQFLERAIPHIRNLDDSFQSMAFQLEFGIATLLTGDADLAEKALLANLRATRELALPPSADALLGLAAIATSRGDHHRAAYLVGAAQTHLDGFEADDVVAKQLDARFFAAARAHYGENAWHASVRQGAAALPSAHSDQP